MSNADQGTWTNSTIDPAEILRLLRKFIQSLTNAASSTVQPANAQLTADQVAKQQREAAEEAGQALWDASALLDPATLLFDSGAVEMLRSVADVAMAREQWRTAELALGTLANMSCHDGIGEKMQGDEDLVEFVSTIGLHCEDARVVKEVCRLGCNLMSYSDEIIGGYDEPTVSFQKFTTDVALERLVWVSLKGVQESADAAMELIHALHRVDRKFIWKGKQGVDVVDAVAPIIRLYHQKCSEEISRETASATDRPHEASYEGGNNSIEVPTADECSRALTLLLAVGESRQHDAYILMINDLLDMPLMLINLVTWDKGKTQEAALLVLSHSSLSRLCYVLREFELLKALVEMIEDIAGDADSTRHWPLLDAWRVLFSIVEDIDRAMKDKRTTDDEKDGCERMLHFLWGEGPERRRRIFSRKFWLASQHYDEEVENFRISSYEKIGLDSSCE